MQPKTFIQTGLFLLATVLSSTLFAQTLDWSSSFSPTWADGATSRTATNVAPGVNVGVTITNSQAGTYQNVTTGVPSPAVNTNNGRTNFFQLNGLSGSTDALEIDVDWTSRTAYVDVVYTFTKPVYNVQFLVGDIDKAGASTTTYFDRVTVTGVNGSTAVLPSAITAVNNASNYIVISGNSVYANTNSGVGGNAGTNTNTTASQQGTAQISFGAQAVTQVTIRYDNHPLAQANPELQAIAIGNLSFNLITISGTVWNDVNNSAGGFFDNIYSTGETGTNISNGLYVNLINSSNVVISSAAVNADGSYSLTAPASASGLTMQLSTTQGTPGTTATTATLPGTWTNTSPLTTVLTTATTDLTGKDFGVEQLPETAINTQAMQGNPGGFNTVTIPASAFQQATNGGSNTVDNGGTVTNMRITSFPTNANAITINTTTYTSGGTCAPSTTCTPWPAGGVTVSYTNGNGPTVPISVDPVEGNVSVVVSFAAIDNAGKEDATPGTVTLPFATIPVTGLVWNDADGSKTQNGTEQVINGTNSGAGLLPGAVLYANLVDPAGKVIATVPVQSNGQYTFTNVPQTTNNLILQISTTQGVVGNTKPATTFPPGWAAASENKNGQGGTADAVADGQIILTAGTTTIIQQNFGLDRLPISAPKSYVISTPPVNTFITLNGSGAAPGALSGNDAEDGTLGNNSKVAITAIPANGNELYYNAVLITKGTDNTTAPSVTNPFIITSFNPALLQIKAKSGGTLGAQFSYAFVDAASLQGTPVNYAITWATPLPVTLTSFTAQVAGNNTVLRWTVVDQVRFDRYEVEYTTTSNGSYSTVATVKTNGQTTGQYQYTHTNITAIGNTGYYRLKMIDTDGSFRYSSILTVRFNNDKAVTVFPTLLKSGQAITINLANSSMAKVISMVDAAGHVVKRINIENTGASIKVATDSWKAGAYFIYIGDENEKQVVRVIVQ